jgi:hypothetical protein
MEKINWANFNEIKKAFDKTLCRGEEKTLLQGQILIINECLTRMKTDAQYLNDKFEQAQRIFANKDS